MKNKHAREKSSLKSLIFNARSTVSFGKPTLITDVTRKPILITDATASTRTVLQ